MHYAVACGIYQLHGEEGERAGLEDEFGDPVAKSVKTTSGPGD